MREGAAETKHINRNKDISGKCLRFVSWNVLFLLYSTLTTMTDLCDAELNNDGSFHNTNQPPKE